MLPSFVQIGCADQSSCQHPHAPGECRVTGATLSAPCPASGCLTLENTRLSSAFTPTAKGCTRVCLVSEDPWIPLTNPHIFPPNKSELFLSQFWSCRPEPTGGRSLLAALWEPAEVQRRSAHAEFKGQSGKRQNKYNPLTVSHVILNGYSRSSLGRAGFPSCNVWQVLLCIVVMVSPTELVQ